jgi:4a-hydroxytetrahydrobiopterin dehydratase
MSLPSMANERLSESVITEQMSTIPGWALEGQTLKRTFKFRDFVEAIAFVNKLVAPAEKEGHHPDILIIYNQVSITLSTHDAGGLTQKDFDLAQIISQL